jgi:outer membrane protein assembly factor BamB
MDVDNDGILTKKDWDQILSTLSKGDNALLAIKSGGSGDITESHVAWRYDRGLPYVPSVLAYQGRVYIVKDGGMLSCFEAKTGKPIYTQERLEAQGNYYASPVAADGLIFLASQNGRVTVIKAGGDKPVILHKADFGEKIPATPALIDDKIYLRTQTKLYAFGKK